MKLTVLVMPVEITHVLLLSENTAIVTGHSMLR